MKTLYRTAFALTKLEQPIRDIHKVAKVCYDWVFEPKPGKPREGLTRPAEVDGQAKTIPSMEIGSGWTIESIYIKDPVHRSWGMKVEHPDHVDSGIKWRVEVVVDVIEARAVFTCKVEIFRTDDSPAYISRRAGQPRVVTSVIDAFGAKDLVSGVDLPSAPLVARKAQIDTEVAFLLNPARQQAVVMVSLHPVTGTPMVDVGLWAKKLSSIAYVMVAEDQDYTYLLREKLGPALICWAGSIRIYYPGFTLMSEKHDHPLLTPDSIAQSLEVRDELALAESVQSQIAEKLSHRGFGSALFWGQLRERSNQTRLAALKASPDDAELARLFEEENTQLRRQVGELGRRVQALETEVGGHREWRQQAVAAIRKIREGVAFAEALRYLPEVDDVREALRVAAAELKGKVVFRLNSKSDEDSPFHRPSDVLNALRWLAGKFHDSKANGTPYGNPDEELRRAVPGWSYAADQTEVTLGKYAEWYRVDYKLANGQTAWAVQHMKYGTGNDPVSMFRIGFLWDPTAKVWVVGYVGPHQKNTFS